MTLSPSPRHGSSQWLVALLLALGIVAFIIFLSLAQITSSGPGSRLLARTVAQTTDTEAAASAIQSDLRQAAEQSEQDSLPVPGFPIPVQIMRDEALTTSDKGLYDRILTTSGDALYNGGISVFDDSDPEASQAIARASTAGAIRLGVGLVGETQHVVFVALTVVAAFAALVLAFGLTVGMTALNRLIALGSVAAGAAIPSLLIGLLLGLLLPSLGSGSYSDGMLDIAVDAEGVAVRNFLIVSLLGVAVAMVGTVGASMQAQRHDEIQGT